MRKKNIYIIPHIPKTAGSTIIQHLNYLIEKDSKNYVFFHLAPQGRHGHHGNNNQFESDVIKGISQDNVIIMGHHVDEGIINYFPNQNIQLITVLRDPLSRQISHYNMIQNRGNTEDSFKQFIVKRNNFMCKYLIKKFPSLIDNVFSTVHVQANSIIDKFDSVYFLEDRLNFFNSFLKLFNLDYNLDLLESRRNDNYINQAGKEKLNNKHIAFLKSDYNFYNQQKNNPIANKKQTPIIQSPHYWYRDYFSNTSTYINDEEKSAHMSNMLPDGFLKSFIIEFIKDKMVYFSKLSSLAIQYNVELGERENFINFQELVEIILQKTYRYEDTVNEIDLTNDMGVLLNSILRERPNSLKELKTNAILSITHKSSHLEIASGKINFAQNNFLLAKENFVSASKLTPLFPGSFYFLYKIYEIEGNKIMAKRALEKCLELKPNNKKFKESYIKLFGFSK